MQKISAVKKRRLVVGQTTLLNGKEYVVEHVGGRLVVLHDDKGEPLVLDTIPRRPLMTREMLVRCFQKKLDYAEIVKVDRNSFTVRDGDNISYTLTFEEAIRFLRNFCDTEPILTDF